MALLTFKGGIHPDDGKSLAKDKAIVDVKPKGDLVYPVSVRRYAIYVATYIGRRFRSRRKSRSKITAAFSLCCLIFIQQYLTNIIHTFAFTGIILQRSNTFRPAKRTLPKLPQDLLRTFRPHLLPLLQSILSPRQ